MTCMCCGDATLPLGCVMCMRCVLSNCGDPDDDGRVRPRHTHEGRKTRDQICLATVDEEVAPASFIVHICDQRIGHDGHHEDEAGFTWNCRCQYRPGRICLNPATQEDGLCDPCRHDGGDGHPRAV